MKQKLSIVERLKATQISLNVICASLDIFWIYSGNVHRKHLPNEVHDLYLHFFTFDREAHFRTAIIGLQTLFDSTARTITLPSLIKDTPMTNLEQKRLLTLVERLKFRTDKVKTLRHNLYAHRSDAAKHNDIFIDADLRRNDLEIVARMSIKILNALAEVHGERRLVRNRDVRDEFLMLLASAKNDPRHSQSLQLR